MAVAQPRSGARAGPFDADGGRQSASYRPRVFLLGLPGYGHILVALVGENTRFRRPLETVAGAEVYRR